MLGRHHLTASQVVMQGSQSKQYMYLRTQTQHLQELQTHTHSQLRNQAQMHAQTGQTTQSVLA